MEEAGSANFSKKLQTAEKETAAEETAAEAEQHQLQQLPG